MTEPLLLLPGLMCDARIFTAQHRAFPEALAAPDYRYDSSFAEMAQKVLDAAPERFALLGHSMGARVAIEVLRRAPERVARLALADTGIHPVAPGEMAKRYALRDLGRAHGIEALIDAWLPPMVAPDRVSDTTLMAPLRAMCRDAGPACFEAQIEALLARPEIVDVLDGFDGPALVAVGSEDRWSPPAQHEAIAAHLARATLTIIPGAGHMTPAEAPGLFNAAISAWLARPV